MEVKHALDRGGGNVNGSLALIRLYEAEHGLHLVRWGNHLYRRSVGGQRSRGEAPVINIRLYQIQTE